MQTKYFELQINRLNFCKARNLKHAMKEILTDAVLVVGLVAWN